MKLKNLKRKVAMVLTVAMATTSVIGTAFATQLTSMPEGQETTNAQGVVDMKRGGSAEIKINGVTGTVGKESMVGKEFRLYTIFNAENAVGQESINYTWTDETKPSIQKVVAARMIKEGKTPTKPEGLTEFKPEDVTEYMAIDYIQTLNTNPVEGAQTKQTEESREGNGFRLFVEELRDQLEKDGVVPTKISVTNTAPDNSITIKGLPVGFYIIDEITKPGTHSAASLCMTRTANGKAEVTLKSDYTDITKSIQENVEGWLEEGGYDFEIGQTVQYKLDSTVPDIRGYHKYVYNHHDLLDEAITFNEDSVKIEITGELKGQPKTYTLQPKEFHVDMKNAEDETFVIAIDDIKKIIDREFNNVDSKRPEGENKYGQHVTVTYTGTVNDKASGRTGNPGFENKIWLEYSFNPDGNGTTETTTTPPSTVKSYTYRLNLTKTNNYDKALAGAEFKLYSDEKCENEIFVKKMDDGYHVVNRDAVKGTDKTGGTFASETMVSDAQGKVIILGLDNDEYWLKETKAPAGYRRILDPIHITVESVISGEDTANHIESLTAKYDMKTFYNGRPINVTNEELVTDATTGEINMTIINEVGKKLPVTGTAAGLIIFVIGLGAVGTAVVMNKKKKAN